MSRLGRKNSLINNTNNSFCYLNPLYHFTYEGETVNFNEKSILRIFKTNISVKTKMRDNTIDEKYYLSIRGIQKESKS